MRPRHRRCTKRQHHAWAYRATLTGWTIARRVECGTEELA